MDDCATQTTPIIATTRLFAKKVSVDSRQGTTHLIPLFFSMTLPTVWIGPLVVKELKRIVESSEIVK